MIGLPHAEFVRSATMQIADYIQDSSKGKNSILKKREGLGCAGGGGMPLFFYSERNLLDHGYAISLQPYDFPGMIREQANPAGTQVAQDLSSYAIKA